MMQALRKLFAKPILGIVPSRVATPRRIVLVNHCTTRKDITPAYLAKVAAAVQKQLVGFCERYGLASWEVSADNANAGLRVALFGPSDVPGALGYHDVDAHGNPYGDVFCDAETLDEISECISHEGLELVGDLWADGWRMRRNGDSNALEACDAVQGTPYRIDGVLVANYVYPAWYVDGSVGPWDERAALKGAHTRTPDGYEILERAGVINTDPPEAKAKKRHLLRRPHARTRRRLENARISPHAVATGPAR